MKRLLLALLLLASPAYSEDLLNSEYCDFSQISGITGWWDSDDLSTLSVDSVGRVASWTSKVINPVTARRESFVQVTDANKPVRTRGDGRENLALYSSDLTNAVWAATDATKTDADTITVTAQNGKVVQNVATVAGQNYVFSVDLKSISGNTGLHLVHTDSATGNDTAKTITSEWVTYTVTVAGKTGSGNVAFGVQDKNAATLAVVDFRNAHVRHANAHPTYIATTAAPVYRGSTTGRSGVRFDGVNDNMTSAATLANVMGASAKTVIVAARPDGVLRDAASWGNDIIFRNNGVYLAISIKASDGFNVIHYDGTNDIAIKALSGVGLNHIIDVTHNGSALALTSNVNNKASVASGNTSATTGVIQIGDPSYSFIGNLYTLITANKVWDSQTRDRITKCLQWEYGAK